MSIAFSGDDDKSTKALDDAFKSLEFNMRRWNQFTINYRLGHSHLAKISINKNHHISC